jgi:peptide-methionine (S)-S-oxide reductase
MSNLETATLGGGCFWCLDAAYNLVKGVHEVVQGYAGGFISNPTYEQVSSGTTNHAEVVQVTYDPKVVSFEDILDIFWTLHNPTTLNRQGYDTGTQYRSIILYHTKEQKIAASSSKKIAAQFWNQPIVTEIKKLDRFFPADEGQYSYAVTRPDYCQIIINPKLQKLRQKYARLLK